MTQEICGIAIHVSLSVTSQSHALKGNWASKYVRFATLTQRERSGLMMARSHGESSESDARLQKVEAGRQACMHRRERVAERSMPPRDREDDGDKLLLGQSRIVG